MTIRFGNKVRLTSCDRWRLWKITQHDPGEIESFDALYNFLESHRLRVPGISKDAAFLRWLIEREWDRLSPGSGYVDLD